MLKEIVTETNIYLHDDNESLKMCVGMALNRVSVSYKDCIIVSFCFTGCKMNYISNVKFKDFTLAMQVVECVAKRLNKTVSYAEGNEKIVNKFIFEDGDYFEVIASQE